MRCHPDVLETPRHVLKDQNVKGLSLVTAPIGTMSRDVQWPDKERHLFCWGGVNHDRVL